MGSYSPCVLSNNPATIIFVECDPDDTSYYYLKAMSGSSEVYLTGPGPLNNPDWEDNNITWKPFTRSIQQIWRVEKITSEESYESYSFNQMAICTDGWDDSYSAEKNPLYGSTSYQQGTAGFRVASSQDISATTVPYIVIPTNHPQYSQRLRDYGVVIDHSTGRYVYAIVAEGGPVNKYCEVSLKAAWDLGFSVSEANGKKGPMGNFEFIIFKGSRTLNYNSTEAQILNSISAEAPKYY